MTSQDPSEIYDSLKKVFEDILGPDAEKLKYPKEALPIGTFIRSTRLDKLGVVIDAFYGDLDLDDQKIITYTVLLFPDVSNKFSNYDTIEKFYVSNEYEYEVIAYLMIGKANMEEVSKYFNLKTGLF
tara:strand:+ start:388 stop:768 length:381 start_codon:yes stop_codon:yes gene_type:complete